MKQIIIKINDKTERNWNYYLKRKWGKNRKSLNQMCKLTIIETIGTEARKELDEINNDIKYLSFKECRNLLKRKTK